MTKKTENARPLLTRVVVTVAPDAALGLADVLLAFTSGIEERRHGQAQRLIAYLPDDQSVQAALDRLRERLAGLAAAGIDTAPATVSARRVRPEKWEEICRASFHITHVPPRIVVKPTWLEYTPQGDEAVVELDPGMAFGTGQHATTRGCLGAIGRHLRPGVVVFDVGAGSGILSIAAAKLGARKVVAIEIDAAAARIAAANVAHNGVAGVVAVVVADGLECVSRDADVVVANITSHDIIALAPAARRHLRPRGLFIASGIAAAHRSRVLAAAESAGFAVREEQREGQWLTVVWEVASGAPAAG